jgi:hypothetical protein
MRRQLAALTMLAFAMISSPILAAPDDQRRVDQVADSLNGLTGNALILAQIRALKRLQPLEGRVDGLALLDRVTEVKFGGQTAGGFMALAASELRTSAPTKPGAAEIPVRNIVDALAVLETSKRDEPDDAVALAELGTALNRLESAGVHLQNLPKLPRETRALIEQAQAAAARPANNAQRDARTRADIDRWIDRVLKGLPGSNPAIQGPQRAFVYDNLKWTRTGYDLSTKGLGLVADAIASGKFDSQSYEGLARDIEAWAHGGPWVNTARDYVKALVAKYPGLGKLVDKLWPNTLPPRPTSRATPSPANSGPRKGGPIDCDCENLDFGIITREYRKVCRAAEAKLRAEYARTGRITGKCDAAAQVPNPHPR